MGDGGMSLFTRILDRIHNAADAEARARGLTVEILPFGGRRIGHPDLPAYLEARRRAVISGGIDGVDLALMDRGTRDALIATRDRMNAEASALYARARSRADRQFTTTG
jgi:hypothetical protein